MHEAPAGSLTCRHDKAIVSHSPETGSSRSDCTATGCTHARVALSELDQQREWSVAPLGDRVVVAWADGKELWIRIGTVAELARTQSRPIADGEHVAKVVAFAAGTAVSVAFSAGDVTRALVVAADGTIAPVVPRGHF